MVAFCFSMTIGVLWEFIECAGDLFFGQDMQKDFIVQVFQSCKLDPTNNQQAIKVADIIKTQIFTASGQVFEVEGGYLDIFRFQEEIGSLCGRGTAHPACAGRTC